MSNSTVRSSNTFHLSWCVTVQAHSAKAVCTQHSIWLSVDSATTALNRMLAMCIYVLQLHQILFFVKTSNIFIFYTNTVCAVWWSRLVFCKCLVQILGRMTDILRFFEVSLNPSLQMYVTWNRPRHLSTKSFTIHHLFNRSMLYVLRS